MSRGISRRQTLTGAAAVGVGVPLLAACGGGTGASPSGGPTVGSGEELGPASDVPVGGGRIYADQKVVVTQPSAGEFRGFSSICTHQGCPVTSVRAGTINCTCHGSRFSIEDGSVSNGPATKPLPSVPVTVEHGQVTTA
ncbi:Rieske (2Fe-2S) protein [Nocardioides sp.]|uniref:Rieske (2Fe-2S) protein n=1 Tax=Nocardioides sp. TaxID=35761 RepID=UPI002615992F|nr:Rieske (2Fe-2S) protein [Nocardioides sp.]MDI6908230.1 Rieske (2Fe-2S) protein [Nocardioides sp.]